MSKASYSNSALALQVSRFSMGNQRKMLIAVILFVALMAFEVFNFDTTQFALRSLLGEVRFVGILWATILAVAFCAIDFAGLIRLFTPQRANGESREVWYLMGAWLLGATMNAVMTWWAVSLTLLDNNFGNEVLSREQLLRYVPIFVAVLVWLTRILFIGAFSVAGEQLFDRGPSGGRGKSRPRPAAKASRAAKQPAPQRAVPQRTAPSRLKAQSQTTGSPVNSKPSARPATPPPPPPPQPSRPETTGGSAARPSRVRQRPPMPNSSRRPVSGVQARPRS